MSDPSSSEKRHIRLVPNNQGTKSQRAAQARRERFVELTADGYNVAESLRMIGVGFAAYQLWRKKHPEFCAAVDQVRVKNRRHTAKVTDAELQNFAMFRYHFFDRDSPGFQLEAIEMYETLPPGDILMILWPPGHGKTTLFEDYACYKFSHNPNHRFTIGSESITLARKVLFRIKTMMSGTKYKAWIARFGPFAPQERDERGIAQPWTADYFNIYRKADHDERDYSAQALGFKSMIAGTRTDHLHCDDIQSTKTYSLTEDMLDVFRQDWLTRPGEEGITTMNGTRVGEGDIYERILEELEDDGVHRVLHLVKFKAIETDPQTGEERALWPENPKFDLAGLKRMRFKVGEEAWARNYQQEPFAQSERTFTDAHIEPCLNPLRAVWHDPPERFASLVMSIDPGLGDGRNCIGAFQFTPDKLIVLTFREDRGLRNNEQIMDALEDTILRFKGPDNDVATVVIEAMNFQRGLARDQRLEEMADRYGFAVVEHLTGINKYDENIGVRSSTTTFRRGQVDIPYADDPATRAIMDDFIIQLKAWKPLKRGTQLRQDKVMAFWFAWIRWRTMRGEETTDTSGWKTRGLPWRPTKAGLLVPARS